AYRRDDEPVLGAVGEPSGVFDGDGFGRCLPILSARGLVCLEGDVPPPLAGAHGVRLGDAADVELALLQLASGTPDQLGAEVEQHLGPRPRAALAEDALDRVHRKHGTAWVEEDEQTRPGGELQRVVEMVAAVPVVARDGDAAG